MLTSNYTIATIKENPTEAEIISHKYMIRAGLIKKSSSGIYSWLPIGLKVLRKVEAIIRKNMDNIGACEIAMPIVQTKELWEETNRWDEYGPMLLKMNDRANREFCFGPTHEEVVTDLGRRLITSYKQLPKCWYQIQVKFRDEIRPRFGIIRGREFLMKDAYSFHLTQECQQTTYDRMFDAYNRIFSEVGLKFRPVLADSGSIGGKLSHEFQALCDIGEDLIAYSDSYAANIERASSPTPISSRQKPTMEKSLTKTPGIKNVDAQAKYMNMPANKILKTLLVKGSKCPVVALLIRGDHTLNEVKAAKIDDVHTPLEMISEDELLKVANCKPGFVGPIGLDIPIFADESVRQMSDFSCGANIDDTHYIGVNFERDLQEPTYLDIRNVLEGDNAPDGGKYKIAKGIEVGHIFQLGDKYSKSMNATVLDKEGNNINMLMGCYGIGVSRIVAAVIEQHHDDKGIIWPKSIAPFQIVIVPIGFHKSEVVKNKALELYKMLIQKGIEVLLDDRNERPGVIFADIDLIGIPHRIVLSEKNLAQNIIEYKSRAEINSKEVNLADVERFVLDLI